MIAKNARFLIPAFSRVFALAAGLLAVPLYAAEAPTHYDATGWAGDFAQLKAGLENSYVNLAWMGSPQSGIDLPRLERRTQAALAGASSDTEARQVLLDFVKAFHDGHLSELPYLARPESAAVPEPLPATLDPLDPATGCAALGYAVTSPVAFSLPFETLPGFVLVADGVARPFRAGLMPAPGDSKLGIIRISNFRRTAAPSACLAAWTRVAKPGAPIVANALNDASGDAWFAALAETLGQLRAKGAKAVIVDVGNNSGGDDSGDWAVRLFTDKPVSSARMLMVAAPVSAGYFQEQIDSMTEGLGHSVGPDAKSALESARDFFARQKASIPPHRCDLAWVWREQRPWRLDACNGVMDAGFSGGAKSRLPRGAYGDNDAARRLSWAATVDRWAGAWTGPAYVLTDGRTFSSAEMFAATMKDNGVARTIGTRTGGDGCGFMASGDPLVLTHSRLRFRVPNCIRLRADGTDEVAGIAPDVPLAPTDGESSRARAARLLRVVAADLPATRQ